jgi:hypothetical protein
MIGWGENGSYGKRFCLNRRDKHRCARDYSFGLAVIFLLLAVAALALPLASS